MACKEVITIQCGHYSNFVGAHWWNLQEAGIWHGGRGEELNSDCTFREGLTLSGKETYTPRAIVIDLPGSLNSLTEEGGSLYSEAHPADCTPGWAGQMETHQANTASKNEFLQDMDRLDEGKIEEQDMEAKSYCFESSVSVWSDFLRLHFHPRSLLLLPEYHHHDERFLVYPAGMSVLHNKEFQLQFEDQLHFFVEECDCLQGFQLMADVHSGGFAAVASGLAQLLHDDFGTKTLLTVGTAPAQLEEEVVDMLTDWLPEGIGMTLLALILQTSKTVLHYTLNSALAWSELTEHSSLFLPLSLASRWWGRVPSDPVTFHPLQITPGLSYHSSALLAVAMETCSSVYRSPHSGESLASIVSLLSSAGRKVCSLSLGFPLTLPAPPFISAYLSSLPLPQSLSSLTPHSSLGELWGHSLALRGYRLPAEGDSPEQKTCLSPASQLAGHLNSTHPTANSQLSILEKPLEVSTPFPYLLPQEPTTSPLKTFSAGACSSLQSHSGLRRPLQELSGQLQTVNLRLAPSFTENCLDRDTYKELCVGLETLATCYRTGSPSECSTDDDA